MTRYSLRARVITLTLAPTLIIGLLLSTFFTSNRYNDLEALLISSGTSIIEPLAIASEHGMSELNHDTVRQIISYAHRKNSNIVRSIAVFDASHQLFVTSNFHSGINSLSFPADKAIPLATNIELIDSHLVLRTPVMAENSFPNQNSETVKKVNRPLGYIAMELDLSPLRLQQYQEIFTALTVLIFGLSLSGLFAYRLMRDVTRPIANMQEMVDKIRRGNLDSRIEDQMHGELDSLKSGINAMAVSLSEYHIEMQHSVDQATSDLRETLEQLEIKNVELDIAKKRAQEAARVKSEFLANMSHELRTPLNGVIGFTRQMLKTRLTSSQTDYLQTIERSANKLLNIINDILDFSKLEAGKLLLENIPFEFQESLEEAATLQATSAHEKGLELTLKVDPKIPVTLIGDPLKIQQVLTNLIGNSIKFTERGNIDIHVELRSKKEDSVELQFMVRDTGIGISERQQAQLFQAFTQADASISRKYGGTGLGLVITQKLVGQMGGKIRLTSRLHQGSTFWFSLRLAIADLPHLYQTEAQYLKNKRVLLIEPNIQAAAIIQQQLEKEGLLVTYHTHVPASFEQQDCVLLNLSPRQTNHFEKVSKWIEQIKEYADQIIVATPSTELTLAEKITQTYRIQCMTKPLSRRKLLSSLTKHQQQNSVIESQRTDTPQSQKLALTVMAVDDNPANLKLIAALLSERVDTVVTCSSGLKALDKAKTQQFDIILMDIQMPQMDGVTACNKIKSTALNKQTPVIAVTAHAMNGERERLLDAGMDDYLTKPIEEHILQQILIHWSSSSKEHQMKVGFTMIQPEPTNQPQKAVVIDWQLALKQAANKEDLAKEMLQMLTDYIADVSKVVTQALGDPDFSSEDLQHCIHKLHGSCSYSGVPILKGVCAEIEKSLHNGSRIEEIEPELFELQDEMNNVLKVANYYLK